MCVVGSKVEMKVVLKSAHIYISKPRIWAKRPIMSEQCTEMVCVNGRFGMGRGLGEGTVSRMKKLGTR